MKLFKCHIDPPLSDNTLSLRGKLCIAFLLALIFTIYFLFSMYVPYSGDDYALIVDYMDANEGDRTFSFRGWMNVIEFLRITDNSRIDNIMFVALRLTSPKWVLALIVAFTATLMSYLSVRLLNVPKKYLPIVLTAWIAWVTFTFPWRGNTMSVDNSFNVFLPAATTILFLMVLSRSMSGEMGRNLFALSCMFALFAGCIHEGYSVPVCCGMGVLAVKSRFKFPVKAWIIAVVYICGASYAVSAPGLWTRLVFNQPVVGGLNVKTLVSMSLPLLVFAITVVIFIFSRYLRERVVDSWRNPLVVIISVAMAVSFLIALKTSILSALNARALWIPDLWVSILLFTVFMPLILKMGERKLSIMAMAALSLVTVFYINLLLVQRDIAKEEYKILCEMGKSPTGTVYRPYSLALSKLTLLHPVNAIWRSGLHANSYNIVHKSDGKIYSVVPAELECLTDGMVDYVNSGRRDVSNPEYPAKVEGDTDLYYFKGALIEKDKELISYSWNSTSGHKSNVMMGAYDYRCSDGRRFDGMSSIKIRFLTRTGRPLIYIAPGHVNVTGPYESISVAE